MSKVSTYQSESKSQRLTQKRQHLVSFVLLCFFCIPGIMGEGLHLILPHREPALIHLSESDASKNDTGTQSNPQNNKGRTQKGPLTFDPFCPICQFCSLAKTKQGYYVIIDFTESVWAVVDVPFISHKSLLSHRYSGRSPPSFI